MQKGEGLLDDGVRGGGIGEVGADRVCGGVVGKRTDFGDESGN